MHSIHLQKTKAVKKGVGFDLTDTVKYITVPVKGFKAAVSSAEKMHEKASLIVFFLPCGINENFSLPQPARKVDCSKGWGEGGEGGGGVSVN